MEKKQPELWEEQHMRTISTKLRPEEKHILQQICRRNSITIYRLLHDLAVMYVRREIRDELQ